MPRSNTKSWLVNPLSITKAADPFQSAALLSMQAYLIPGIARSDRSINNIVHHCCEFYEISQHKLVKKSRYRHLVEKRYMIFYILRNRYKYTFQSIADNFLRDHTTVVHGNKVMGIMISLYSHVRIEHEQLINHLKKNNL